MVKRMFYKLSLVIIFSFYEHNTQLSLSQITTGEHAMDANPLNNNMDQQG